MRDGALITALSAVPVGTSRLMGWIADGNLSRLASSAFVAAYGVDLSDAVVPTGGFRSLDALFTRRLRAGARPVDADPDALVAPVDGTVAWVGTTRDGRFEALPGRLGSLARLLGEPVGAPRDVAVLYLSPRDYHRVHAPRTLRVTSVQRRGGRRLPVAPWAVARTDDLLGSNERVVLRARDAEHVVHVVLVGAFGVGRVDVPVCGPSGPQVPGPVVARGADLGVFHLGSTVVLSWPRGLRRWCVDAGQSVRVGEALARP